MVIDASALVEILLRTDRATFVQGHAQAAMTLHAPDLIDVEVASVLRRAELHGDLSTERAEQALLDLRDLRLTLHRMRPLLARAWSLRSNFGVPDAFYASLAEVIDVPLLTTDGRLARALRKHTGVEVLAPE